MSGSRRSRLFAAGIAVAVVTSLLTVWTTVVRDDGDGIGYFLVVAATGVGGFAARLDAAGMMRTMIGVAAMQMLLGVAIATAPITASAANGPWRVMMFNGTFAALWLLSATFFGVAARRGRPEAASL